MKIYTRRGDDGSTGLIGGSRIDKSDARIECTGSVDELNAAIGLAAVAASEVLVEKLRAIQNELFIIGSHLGAPDPGAAHSLPVLEEASIDRLEMEIDAAESDLAPLKNFILPGGCEIAARLHFARTVCRRAERVLVNFSHDRPVSGLILSYFNRLSDWLFVHARWTNQQANLPDILWKKPS